eukprot:TRINITY_DN4219_c0_g1_i14.p1 TRINITY_DN4219_c0_g1~~TRINITY_DN4219_c0_g1_i14.p1  ORF type:complete len:570 (+),score=103.85 TRINITY_DN4219_c0_g1_i14:85-1794(+)
MGASCCGTVEDPAPPTAPGAEPPRGGGQRGAQQTAPGAEAPLAKRRGWAGRRERSPEPRVAWLPAAPDGQPAADSAGSAAGCGGWQPPRAPSPHRNTIHGPARSPAQLRPPLPPRPPQRARGADSSRDLSVLEKDETLARALLAASAAEELAQAAIEALHQQAVALAPLQCSSTALQAERSAAGVRVAAAAQPGSPPSLQASLGMPITDVSYQVTAEVSAEPDAERKRGAHPPARLIDCRALVRSTQQQGNPNGSAPQSATGFSVTLQLVCAMEKPASIALPTVLRVQGFTVRCRSGFLLCMLDGWARLPQRLGNGGAAPAEGAQVGQGAQSLCITDRQGADAGLPTTAALLVPAAGGPADPTGQTDCGCSAVAAPAADNAAPTAAVSRGRDLLEDCVSHCIAMYVPRSWAPVCSATARSVITVQLIHGKIWVFAGRFLGAFRSRGPDNRYDARKFPETGPIWAVSKELRALKAQVVAGPLPEVKTWTNRWFMYFDMACTLLDDMRLKHQELFLTACEMHCNAQAVAGTLAKVLEARKQRLAAAAAEEAQDAGDEEQGTDEEGTADTAG